MKCGMRFVAIGTVFIGIGCRSKVEMPPPNTATMIAGPVVVKADEEYVPKVQPIMKIVAPKPGSHTKKGETLDIELTIEVPAGSYVPNTIMLGFSKNPSDQVVEPFVFQKQLDERTYQFRARPEVRFAPGRYKIWAESITPLIFEANSKTGMKKETELLRCKSNVIEIEVRP